MEKVRVVDVGIEELDRHPASWYAGDIEEIPDGWNAEEWVKSLYKKRNMCAILIFGEQTRRYWRMCNTANRVMCLFTTTWGFRGKKRKSKREREKKRYSSSLSI